MNNRKILLTRKVVEMYKGFASADCMISLLYFSSSTLSKSCLSNSLPLNSFFQLHSPMCYQEQFKRLIKQILPCQESSQLDAQLVVFYQPLVQLFCAIQCQPFYPTRFHHQLVLYKFLQP